MLSRVISIFLCLTIFALPVYAAECLDIFPTLSQNYGPKLNLPDFKYSSENERD